MSFITDQHSDITHLPACPNRIISLVPSITELLHYLGLEEKVLGVTKFCVRPHNWYKEKTKIGGTKKVDMSKIALLSPDLIIANKEENSREDVLALQEICTVSVTDIKTLDDALSMITAVGDLTCSTGRAEKLNQEIALAFQGLKEEPSSRLPPVSAIYLIWRNPYMTVGCDTFISKMMGYCNLKNAFTAKSRYPEVDIEELKISDCRLILLSSEPYPFNEHHMKELQDALPGKTIMLVDGEMFSWYGSRLLYAAPYFRQVMNAIRNTGLTTERE